MGKSIFKVSLSDVLVEANDQESAIEKFTKFAQLEADGDLFKVELIENPDDDDKALAIDIA